MFRNHLSQFLQIYLIKTYNVHFQRRRIIRLRELDGEIAKRAFFKIVALKTKREDWNFFSTLDVEEDVRDKEYSQVQKKDMRKR